jgi:hypothetical protein
MPTKTERILGYLPHTFRPADQFSPLRALVDSPGGELQSGENTLAGIMRAHWVDTADSNEEAIVDLAQIGAMYGLTPQPTETVELYRTHLKRYVRTCLEGSATVEGILRTAADILGVAAATDRDTRDSWWNRSNPILETVEALGEDAAERLFGKRGVLVSGRDARPARVTGSVDLSGGVDLRGGSRLTIVLDGHSPRDIDLAKGVDPATIKLDRIKQSINDEFGFAVASHNGHFLTLTSPTIGPASRLELAFNESDAALAVLGLPPRKYRGRNARPAAVESVDLSRGADLSRNRYLRIFLDTGSIYEIDCAGAIPGATQLDELKTSINTATGVDIASHDGKRLRIESKAAGTSSRVFVQRPAAQDAAVTLFGGSNVFRSGDDDRPAVLKGLTRLPDQIDLSRNSILTLQIDERPPIPVDCAGQDPKVTTPAEIVEKLNAALGGGTAAADSGILVIQSGVSGAPAQIESGGEDQNDAADVLLGLPSRVFKGTPALPAFFEGLRDLSSGLSTIAQYRVAIAFDQKTPIIVALTQTASLSARDIAHQINAAIGEDIASSPDGKFLSLGSPTLGASSRIEILPLATVRKERYVSRAMLLGEAADALFGSPRKSATGDSATRARVTGTVDLSPGVDLRDTPYLNLAIDGTAVLVNCAGARPRFTVLEEIRRKLEAAFPAATVTSDGKHLFLVSPSEGPGSRIEFRPVRAEDGLPVLLGVEPVDLRGQDASRVVFTGTVKHGDNRVPLPAGARLKIRVDGTSAEIVLNDTAAEVKLLLTEIAARIDLALGVPAAFRESGFLGVHSNKTGEDSEVAFEVPGSGFDATQTLFGILAPREYHGDKALPAELKGVRNLAAGADVSVQRFLRISVNGAPAKNVDCSKAAAIKTAATLDEVVQSVNTQMGVGIASHDGKNLSLRSPAMGTAGRLSVEAYVSIDAREKIFGPGPPVQGKAAVAAFVKGEVDLANAVNLRGRTKLLLSMDGGRPEEIDVAGPAPDSVPLQDIIERINAVLPGVASRTDDDRLQLTSPSTGIESTVEVLPRRFIDLIEYSTAPQKLELGPVSAAQQFSVNNTGTGQESVEIEIQSVRGVFGAQFDNEREGARITFRYVLNPGETARLYSDGGLWHAVVTKVDGSVHQAPADAITVTYLQPRELPDAFRLAAGISTWRYLECVGPRFDEAAFNAPLSVYPGAGCRAPGVFNISRFHRDAFFAGPEPLVPNVNLTFHWTIHSAGEFILRLPAELPLRFGGRFDEARFASATPPAPSPAGDVTAAGTEQPQPVLLFDKAVSSPPSDKDLLKTRLNDLDTLAFADDSDGSVPIGFLAAKLPFRKPRYLTGGTAAGPARLYIREEGFPNLIRIQALESGEYGNRIAVSTRPDGPGRFEYTILFDGDRFESARSLVLGPPVDPLAQELLKPGTLGILQAKAAGVRVRVIRERTPESD